MIYRQELKDLGWSNELLDAIEDMERALPQVLESRKETFEPVVLVEEWAPPPCDTIDLASTTPPAFPGLTLGGSKRRTG